MRKRMYSLALIGIWVGGSAFAGMPLKQFSDAKAASSSLISWQALAKEEYPIIEVSPYLNVWCENGVGRYVQVENPSDSTRFLKQRLIDVEIKAVDAPTRLPHLRTFFRFLFDRTEVDFETNETGDFWLVLKGGWFGNDRKVHVGRVKDIPGQCSAWHTGLFIANYLPLEISPSIEMKAERTVSRWRRFAPNWPTDTGWSCWRNTHEVVTFTDRETGVTVTLERDSNIEC